MKKWKIFPITSLSLFAISSIGFLISCSKSDNNKVVDYKEEVNNFISTINIKLKTNKDKSTIYANQLNNETILNEWFDNLPKSNNEIKVSFISSNPSNDNSTILEIRYLISSGDYKQEFIYQESGFKSNILAPDVDDEVQDFSDFASKNSFRVQFQTSANSGGPFESYFVEQGTAWSWYYEQKGDNQWDWYLITNFHVIDSAVTFLAKQSGNSMSGDMLNYYANNSITNVPTSGYSFSVDRYENGYIPLVATYGNSMGDSILSDQISSISIITDFNNDNVKLFSENSNGDVLYNLDMALIKISFNFKNDNYKKTEYIKPNNFLIYSEYKDFFIENKFNPNKTTYIGGHPSKANKLITLEVTQGYYLDYSELNYQHYVWSKLKGPYFYSNVWFENYKLSNGASGSAVYQQPQNYISHSWNKIAPVGIYWGGLIKSLTEEDTFKPSLLPFICDMKVNNNTNLVYNIYDNFQNWITKN
ncbi:MAG: hypothetical protein HDR43_00705 [Mycoplasma sp.]|nr:hypothetical protein [Mycoplasma sp.]